MWTRSRISLSENIQRWGDTGLNGIHQTDLLQLVYITECQVMKVGRAFRGYSCQSTGREILRERG